mmetsp:Transcript_36161/g.88355  ORF Transcript_36161/g.88355 Transcript_36161/m.88355 type:complete len:89 (+) Transcript_36161:52-318(+)
MPTLLIKTNVEPGDKEAMMKEASKAMAAGIRKPENFVMVEHQKSDMIFAGTADPCGFLYITSLGNLGPEVNPGMAKELCALLERHCGM